MTELTHFQTRTGELAVEISDGQSGFELAGRSSTVAASRRLLEEMLAQTRETAASALSAFREGPDSPDKVEVEFGVKLTAQAGAVIAKTAAEGHFLVRLQWSARAEAGTSSDGL
jgi:hypothetical protein